MEDKNAVKNYIALEEEYSSLKKSKVVVMQVPYDKTATYVKGTVNGPQAIIDLGNLWIKFF